MFQRFGPFIFLFFLIIAGIGLAVLDPADRELILAWGEAMAGRPWTPILMILVQAALFTVAMPGSLVLWLVAPFYHPVQATLILLIGTLAGALGGYAFSARLGQQARERLSHRKAFRILAQRSDFLTQCALRVLPGFPHSIVNYGAGILRIPVWKFSLAVMCGMLVKWGVYTTAVYGIADADEIEDLLRPITLLPLLVLTLFLMLGSWAARRFQDQTAPDDPPRDTNHRS